MAESSIIDVTTLQSCLLANNVKLKPVKVLYSTMQSGPGVKPDIVKQNPNTFIPFSLEFDLQGHFSVPNHQLSNTMISSNEFQKQVRALGITNDDCLVIYDDFGNFCASRVWFMFKSMGHKNVFLLDGGLPAWLAANYASVSQLTRMNDKCVIKSDYIVVPNQNYEFVDAEFILRNLHNKEYQIIDARSFARFLGETPEAKAYLRAGHIPNSKSMHYATLQNEQACFLPLEHLQQAFSAYANKSLVFSCGSGITACILAQAATLVGYTSCKVYDGSWSDWGANKHYPISTGTQ